MVPALSGCGQMPGGRLGPESCVLAMASCWAAAPCRRPHSRVCLSTCGHVTTALPRPSLVPVPSAGICHAHYTYYNVAPEAQVTLRRFFEVAAFLCETFVFAYLGLQVGTGMGWVRESGVGGLGLEDPVARGGEPSPAGHLVWWWWQPGGIISSMPPSTGADVMPPAGGHDAAQV